MSQAEQLASQLMSESRGGISEWLLDVWPKVLFLRHGVELEQPNPLLGKLSKRR
jgi:hypothetical protein